MNEFESIVPSGDTARAGRGQPDSLSMFDRSRERRAGVRHASALADLRREVEKAQAGVAARCAIECAQIEATSRRISEVKYAIHRAHTESKLLAGDDPELLMKLNLIDDTVLQVYRMREIRGLGR